MQTTPSNEIVQPLELVISIMLVMIFKDCGNKTVQFSQFSIMNFVMRCCLEGEKVSVAFLQLLRQIRSLLASLIILVSDKPNFYVAVRNKI